MYARKNGIIVLAEGEATGHYHEIEGGTATLIGEDNSVDQYLRVDEESTVKHAEHKPVTLPPGDYNVGIVREQDHFKEEARNVMD